MADAVRLISIRRGYDPREFALVVFGGAGPLHGAALAKELGDPDGASSRRSPGITSALGCLLVDIRHDLSEMFLRRVDDADAGASSTRRSRELEAEGRERLAAEGVRRGRMTPRALDRHALPRPVALAGGRRSEGSDARRRRRALPRRARARVLLPPRRRAGRALPARSSGRSASRPKPELAATTSRRRRAARADRDARRSTSTAATRSTRRSTSATTLPAGARVRGPGGDRPARLDDARPARRRRPRSTSTSIIRDGGALSTATELHARSGHLRGAQELVRHRRRPDGRADPAHLPLVRHLLRATSRARCATPAATRSCRAPRTSPCTSARCTSRPRR